MSPFSHSSKAISLFNSTSIVFKPYFSRSTFLALTTNLVILKHSREELYAGINLSRLCPSIVSQIWSSLLSNNCVPNFTTIFSGSLRVTTGRPSSSLSSSPSKTTSPSTMEVFAPQACDDSLLPCLDGGHPLHGHDYNSFPLCPHHGNKNHPTKKCWKQFNKPSTTQAIVIPSTTFLLASPSSLAPHIK